MATTATIIAAVVRATTIWSNNPWNGLRLQGLVRIESERYQKATGKIEREICYSITSLSQTPRGSTW